MAWSMLRVAADLALPHPEKVILLKLADRADENGRNAYESIRRMATWCGVSERTVQRGLRQLKDQHRLIAIQAGPSRYRPATYMLLLDRIAAFDTVAAALSREDGAAAVPDERGDTASPRQRESEVPCERVERSGGDAETPRRTARGDTRGDEESRSLGDTRGATPSPDPIDPDEPTEYTAAPQRASLNQTGRPQTSSNTPPPFKVYVAIAKKAIDTALRQYRRHDIATVIEQFKEACARESPPLPYHGIIARKACEAALFARDKAKREAIERHRILAVAAGARV